MNNLTPAARSRLNSLRRVVQENRFVKLNGTIVAPVMATAALAHLSLVKEARRNQLLLMPVSELLSVVRESLSDPKFTDMEESINDKNLFKAIFVTGPAGSGKTTIVKQMMGPIIGGAMRIVNSDDAFEHLIGKRSLSFDMQQGLTPAHVIARADAKKLTGIRFGHWVNGMLPLLLDGTGKDYAEIAKKKEVLESWGYDTYMLVVYTDDVAVNFARNAKRRRKVPEPVVVHSWEASQANRPRFKQLFGKDYFEVNNTGTLPEEEDAELKKKISGLFFRWLKSPLKNSVGLATIRAIKEAGVKNISDLSPEAFANIIRTFPEGVNYTRPSSDGSLFSEGDLGNLSPDQAVKVLFFLRGRVGQQIPDAAVHELATKIGASVDDTESFIYGLAAADAADQIPGGLSDKLNSDFIRGLKVSEVAMGLEVEKEHTKNLFRALEITLDHLRELPDYYTRLKAVENN